MKRHCPRLTLFLTGILLTWLVGCQSWPARRAIDKNFSETGGGYVDPPKQRKQVVVFVHGVFGDQSDTWRSQDGEDWPHLLAKDMPEFAVYSVDYHSPFRGRAADIDEIATRVRGQLKERGVFEFTDIHVVAHSMGGLITKALLLDLYTPEGAETLRRVKTVAFLATPAQGATIADVADWLSNNPQLSNMSAKDLNTFLHRLERQWKGMLRSRAVDAKWPLVYCAYEKQAVAGLVLVVPRLYTETVCDEDPRAMETMNHISIAKPTSVRSEQYTWAKDHILQAARVRAPAGVSPGRRAELLKIIEDSLKTINSQDQVERDRAQLEHDRAMRALFPEWNSDLGSNPVMVVFGIGEDAISRRSERVQRAEKFTGSLIELLGDPAVDARLRAECAHSLAKIGGSEAAEALLAALASSESSAEIRATVLHGPPHFWGRGAALEEFMESALAIINTWPATVCNQVAGIRRFDFTDQLLRTAVVLCSQRQEGKAKEDLH